TARHTIESALGRALSLVGETGGKALEPFIRVELSNLARLAGDEATRRRELHEAHVLFTEMGAPLRAEPVAREPGAGRAAPAPPHPPQAAAQRRSLYMRRPWRTR